MMSRAKLSQALGLDLKSSKLLQLALTHKSKGRPHNERLEFLGDAILSFVVTTALYERYPQLEEGALSRLRSSLVKGERLTQLAQDLSLGDYIQLGPGELKSGGHHRKSILADALEAVIGAIYLEKGLEVATQKVLSWYGDQLTNLSLAQVEKDSKTLLQEWLQAKGESLPIYEVVETRGQPHDQIFIVHCTVSRLDAPTVGRGNSRRQAEQFAAEKALGKLGVYE